MKKCNGRSKAFTLVELLVVVSIIALLIAILLPSLKKARETTKRIACAANLTGISKAGLTYAADDPNEFGIPIGLRDANDSDTLYSFYAFGGKSGVFAPGYPKGNVNQSKFSGGLNDPVNDNAMGAFYRPLNSIIYKSGFSAKATGGGLAGASWEGDANLDLGIYHCPGDKGFSGMHHNGWKQSGLSSYDFYGTSYATNPMWIYHSGDTQLFSNAVYRRPLSRVPNPANTVMFWENAARFASFADNPEMGDDQPPDSCRPVYDEEYVAKGWHGQPWNFNVAFADGHASWVKVRSYKKATGIQQSSVCGDNNETCVCIIARGNGWQLDCLPAPYVPTNKALGSGSTKPVQGTSKSDEWFGIVP